MSDEKAIKTSYVSAKILKIINKGWLIPIYRVLYSALLIIIGAHIGSKGFDGLAAILFASYVVVFGLLEYLLSKSIDQVKEETRESVSKTLQIKFDEHEKSQNKLEFNMSFFFSTNKFLSSQLQRTIRMFNQLQSSITSGEIVPTQLIIKKERIIENTLNDLCSTFKSITSKKHGIPITDVMFRATYMIIKENAKGEKLTYYAWSTPGGNPPRSKSMNKYFKKDVGVAGITWARERVVIEDEFKHRSEWIDNYPGQGDLYKSMACMPVFSFTLNNKDTIIGVITIDTNIEGLFGKKNDKEMEEVIANWIRPYADYIAFTTIVNDVVINFSDLISNK